jgi:2-methylisocitrate lyase-like PEP mutase family enzyme
LPNAWDAKSAQVFQENGFQAVGTSSAAVASGLGYEDGEGMPFEDYLFAIRRIVASVKIPVTIDLEMGYGKSDDRIIQNIEQLIGLGIAGINIEDSVIVNSKRSLADAGEFASRIRAIRTHLSAKKLPLFINIRCDTYILNVNDVQSETASRIKLYNKTGADGIFLPCIKMEEDIAAAVHSTKLPLNVMCIPGLPDFDVLNKLGVKRASMGPFLFNKVYKHASALGEKILDNNSFKSIL